MIEIIKKMTSNKENKIAFRTCFSSISYYGHKLDKLKSGVQKYLRRSAYPSTFTCDVLFWAQFKLSDTPYFKRAFQFSNIFPKHRKRRHMVSSADMARGENNIANIWMLRKSVECINLVSDMYRFRKLFSDRASRKMKYQVVPNVAHPRKLNNKP